MMIIWDEPKSLSNLAKHVLRPTRFHLKCIFMYGTITLYRGTFQSLSALPLAHVVH